MTQSPAFTQQFTLGSHHYIAHSETNQRDNNEDSYQVLTLLPGQGLIPPLTLLAVADGMGGHAHGELVSAEVLGRLSLALFEQLVARPSINCLEPPSPSPAELTPIIQDALLQVNEYVKKMVKVNHWGKAGSTLVLALVQNNLVTISNLGDSPLFHFDAEQQTLTQITHDHTVAAALFQAGLIPAEMLLYHEGKSKLEFYMGCEHLPNNIPIHHLELKPNDCLLLCSDGIHGSVPLTEIEQLVLQHNHDLSQLASRLIQAGQAAGETDNQTLILWKNGYPSPPPHRKVSPTIVELPNLKGIRSGQTIESGLRFEGEG